MDVYGRLVAGRYRLAERIGAGGMGVVWRAYDERLHRQVAAKRLLMPAELTGPQAERARRQAMREGRIAARLQHPHVIAVYDVVADGEQAYLIMEYLPSESLSQRLAGRGPLPVPEAARIGAQLADALDAAHTADEVHRDVKPGNVLLGPDGTVKLTDFGISRAVDDVTGTTTGILAGTPAFLAPEVAQGKPATTASDVYSLGATLYAATEGIPPSGSADNAMAILYRVASGVINPPTRAGPMTALLMRMLDPLPGARPSMAEVRDQLTALVTQPAMPSPALAPEPSLLPATAEASAPAAEREVPHRNRLRVAAIVGAAVVLLAAAILALALTRGGPDSGPATAGPPAQSSGTSQPQAAAPPNSAPPATTTTRSVAPAPPPPSTGTPAPPRVPATPADTITAYYALMPASLPTAWTWLTPKYQQHPAGGYGGYQTFWANVRQVRATDVNAVSGNQVEATVEYSFKDGRIIRERHRYTLIQQNRWMIDQSVVLSSRTFT